MATKEQEVGQGLWEGMVVVKLWSEMVAKAREVVEEMEVMMKEQEVVQEIWKAKAVV